jgi:hypothetical protein
MFIECCRMIPIFHMRDAGDRTELTATWMIYMYTTYTYR